MVNYVGQQFGSFRLIRLLGHGGFADVYLGEHVRLNMQAAIKILHTHFGERETEAFRHEAQIIVDLTHPHIVRILDFDVQNSIPFLIMDYAPNGSLRQAHPKESIVPLPIIVSYVQQVAAALQYAHDQKLIHRDVKPENMLLGKHKEVLLADFGIATIAHNSSSQSMQNIAGTTPYMAPEQIQARPSSASDQYSLGIVVYEWLCGERPFQGTLTEIAVKHCTVLPPPLQEKMPTILPEVERVVLTALAKNPHKRFVTIEAFAQAFVQASRPGFPSLSILPPAITPLKQIEYPSTSTIPTGGPTLITKGMNPQDEPEISSNLVEQSQWEALPMGMPTSPSLSQISQTEDALSFNADPLLLSLPHSNTHVLSPPTIYPSHRRFPKRIAIFLIGIALLVIAGSVGLFSFVQNDQVATNNIHVTATAVAATTTIAENHATATANAIDNANANDQTATAIVVGANPNPYPPHNGTLALYDPLSHSNSASWSDSSGCHFLNKAYHVNGGFCSGASIFFNNLFIYEVQTTIIKGECSETRLYTTNGRKSGADVYYLDVCQSGYYFYGIYAGGNYIKYIPKEAGIFSSSIIQGLNQTNLLAIAISIHTVTLYINQQQVFSIEDNAIDTNGLGQIGLDDPYTISSDDIVFRNVKVWTV